ncbi:hypothetical protein SAMN05660380_01448 [Xylella fastidiosa]|jgi:hypothetical protein|uniref:Uncharacterized protein n=1 Tax=Xylella fastidiosa (strain M23) TaxID=405441 RepID=B2I6H3_XYLF2|nr:hypothetical protein XfasM23_1472 [Xylella fastidiosa M23]RWA32762.1 hypothetical protein XfCFBP7969_08065 [Xylella fastidiosa subsp. fastidiosa]RWA35011.1 hypothetical protein XfCFBP7970_07905 [Xylella fastidiosa subsp. fastidiosa]SHG79310.1 hypothetical protein SAMN05660380_01448 [Xylella fastidiosa]
MHFQDVFVLFCYISGADTLCVLMEIIVFFLLSKTQAIFSEEIIAGDRGGRGYGFFSAAGL